MMPDTTLMPASYDPAFTEWRFKFNYRNPGDPAPTRTGPMRTTPIPFAIQANVPMVIASQNQYRKGLLIKNLDPTDLLYIGFGTLADINGMTVEPLQTMLFDFVCPTDTISVFATANIRGYYAEFAPIAE